MRKLDKPFITCKGHDGAVTHLTLGLGRLFSGDRSGYVREWRPIDGMALGTYWHAHSGSGISSMMLHAQEE